MRKLFEAIEVPGAQLLYESNSYDVFKITTWAAAQSFVLEGSGENAGTYYVQNENTFNEHIDNETSGLFFFVRSNTNNVVLGALLLPSQRGSITIKGTDGQKTIMLNSGHFTFEDTNDHSAKTTYDVPLSVLNQIETDAFSYDNAEIIVEDGFVFDVDGKLCAIIPGLRDTPETTTHIEELNTSDYPNMRWIDKDACAFGATIDRLWVADMDKETFHIEDSKEFLQHFDGIIRVPFDEKPADWPFTWCGEADEKGRVIWNEERTPEELAEIKRQKEEAEARVEAERLEQERLAAEKQARALRYRVDKNEITILGTRKGVTNLTIPDQIEGKPVTKIDDYAFYDVQLDELHFECTHVYYVGKAAFKYCKVESGKPTLYMDAANKSFYRAINAADYSSIQIKV